jgi:protein involved in polysaccharide export with SLBB domain
MKGYLKYPVVSVSVIESRSRSFTISGEVTRPGTYPLTENTTVLKSIAIAGGFTRFGSSTNVKILRLRKDQPGYESITVNIKKIVNGESEADILIMNGDIVVVSQSLF